MYRLPNGKSLYFNRCMKKDLCENFNDYFDIIESKHATRNNNVQKRVSILWGQKHLMNCPLTFKRQKAKMILKLNFKTY